MANRDIQQETVSVLQLITRGLQKLLGPFAIPGQKAILKEYFASLGIEDTEDFKEPKTTKLDEFNQRKAEEANVLAFTQAMKELTDIVVNIADFIKSVTQNSSPQVASDFTTALLNALSTDYIRRENPTFHNFILILCALNNMTNRGGGAVPIGSMVKDYVNKWWDSMDFDFETREEARNFTEVWFALLTVGSYLLNRSIRKATGKNPEVDITIGGQFGYELERKTTLATPQDEINDLLGRAFTFSYTQTNLSKGELERDVSSIYLTFLPLADENNGSGVIVITDGEGTLKNLRLSDNWFVTLDLGGSLAVRVGGTSDEQASSSIGDLPVNFHTTLAFEYLPFKKGITLDDVELKTLFDIFRLGFGNLSFQLEITNKDITFRFVSQLIYAIQKGDKKGFPYTFIPEKKDIVELPFRLSLKNGFGFDGGFVGERPPDKPKPKTLLLSERDLPASSNGKMGTLDIPIHRELGIVRFDKLHIGFDIDKGLGLDLTLDFTLKFGKSVVISIIELGTSIAATERTEEPKQGGFLGYDIMPAFVPPKGAGLVIDAKIIKGAGFLYFNDKKGEYYGAIELGVTGLSFLPDTKLSAIGIIRTKDDAGREQFSLLMLITAEFLPIQIGFGFTWNGVGGLLALNRKANLEYLQEGLGSGVLQSILFPRDVVANMSRIISDLTSAFPIADKNLVVGLMVKLGWGNLKGPPKITADIGLIVDICNRQDFRIVLVGILRAILPTEEKPVLNLQAAFLGIYDHKNEFLYFRADLINSSLLSFKLTGSLVLGISWGTPSVFVLSAGGFHPRFREIPSLPTLPNAFRNLQRVGIQLLDDDNPRLSVETYFAVTSNTVQIGGKAEFFYDVFSGEGGYNVYGRLEVNALFHFNPFHFIFDIAAEIALRDGQSWVMGIGVYGELEGPKPWHLKARAVVELAWWLPDIEVELEMTWGSKSTELPPAVAQVNILMRDALKDVRNWEAKTDRKTGVLLQKNKTDAAATSVVDTANILRLDPGGGLKFSQRIAPLDVTLQKFGEQRADVNLFTIKPTTLPSKPVSDLFAADMFMQLTDDERLSRPSFERMLSGFELTDSDTLKVGALQVISVTGEISGLDSSQLTNTQGDLLDLNSKFGQLVRASSSTYKSAASAATRIQRNSYKHLAAETDDAYVVVTKDTLGKPDGFVKQTFTSFAEAHQAIQAKPLSQRLNLQVIKNREVI